MKTGSDTTALEKLLRPLPRVLTAELARALVNLRADAETQTRYDTLALACTQCNFHKGTNLTGIDPETGKTTPLFHPRRERWDDHFSRAEANIIGRTAAGRTTAWLLEMNSGDRLRLRNSLLRLGLLT